jgi:fatty acid synthase
LTIFQIAYHLVNRDLKSGVIKPLNTTIFDAGDVEEAFRYMASGKHMGKVLLKVRQHEHDESSLPLVALNRVFVDADEVVFIAGGLGGFGMELADWLVLRGCRKLMLSSKRGITSKNQFLKIE